MQTHISCVSCIGRWTLSLNHQGSEVVEMMLKLKTAHPKIHQWYLGEVRTQKAGLKLYNERCIIALEILLGQWLSECDFQGIF